ncbi:MAG: hypothetical protein WBD23_16300 [Candidatus Acidiferrales bacterium]
MRIRGVFAEADEQNRAHRLLVDGEPVGGNLILYVGINNLKNPEQRLYELADPPANDPRHGQVITVTSYVLAAVMSCLVTLPARRCRKSPGKSPPI